MTYAAMMATLQANHTGNADNKARANAISYMLEHFQYLGHVVLSTESCAQLKGKHVSHKFHNEGPARCTPVNARHSRTVVWSDQHSPIGP